MGSRTHPKERGEKKLRKDPEKERERKLNVGGRKESKRVEIGNEKSVNLQISQRS